MFVPISNTVVAGRYELIDEIGRGGMGVVWRARQANLGVECAIKFIHEAHASDPDVRRRFVREARVAASLKSPNSVHILDVDEWQGTLFIAMELLSGESLEARLSRERSLSPELTLAVIDQVARGLTKAHAARLVHRDLKPENIFLVDEDPLLVKILDFGIAKRIGTGSGLQTTSGVLIGTPGYMSPEQADGGKELDFRSDLWSLAVVAFRCLTGVAPFDGDGVGQVLLKVMTGPIPAPRNLRPDLPATLDAWWFSVVQREPSLRPASATALASGLREALTGKARGSTEASDAEPHRSLLGESPQFQSRQPPSLQPQSLQPTLQPVSSRPGRRGHSFRRYAFSAVTLLAACGGVLAIRAVFSGSGEGEDAHPALAQPRRSDTETLAPSITAPPRQPSISPLPAPVDVKRAAAAGDLAVVAPLPGERSAAATKMRPLEPAAITAPAATRASSTAPARAKRRSTSTPRAAPPKSKPPAPAAPVPPARAPAASVQPAPPDLDPATPPNPDDPRLGF